MARSGWQGTSIGHRETPISLPKTSVDPINCAIRLDKHKAAIILNSIMGKQSAMFTIQREETIEETQVIFEPKAPGGVFDILKQALDTLAADPVKSGRFFGK